MASMSHLAAREAEVANDDEDISFEDGSRCLSQLVSGAAP